MQVATKLQHMAVPGLLSIVIITYNRHHDMLELCKSIAEQQNKELLQEVIILNNCSTTSYDEVTSYIEQHPEIPFVYKIAPGNLGVSKGRQYAIQFATAPILFLIDDDTVFEHTQSLQRICSSFVEQPRPIAIVSFLVRYYSNHQVQQNVFPHKQFEKHQDLERFPTSYFVGCAHAVSADALKACGGYPTDFFYGMEEYDLSYRILNKGYSIWYESGVTVLHKESPQGRRPRLEILRQMWVNKSMVAWRYLPKQYFFSTVILWSCFCLVKSKFNLKIWLQGWTMIWQIPDTQKRTPVSKDTRQYLEEVNARLWY